MNYEERKKWICEQCNQKTDCAYIIRNMEYKCLLVEERMEGWELGYKDAIDKACEFLKSYRQETPDGMGYIAGIVNDETIKDFRKYMEEQQ